MYFKTDRILSTMFAPQQCKANIAKFGELFGEIILLKEKEQKVFNPSVTLTSK